MKPRLRKIPLPANDWLEALGYHPGDVIRFYTDPLSGEIVGIAPINAPVDEPPRIA